MHGDQRIKIGDSFRVFIVYVQYVNDNGNVNYNDCNWNDNATRPFWCGRRRKVGDLHHPKLESRNQKNKYPFLLKWQDKHKGTKYYDRR